MQAPRNPHLRAAIEIGFIIFLFYANLLMGEFTRSAAHPGMTLFAAMANIITIKTFAIALSAASAGHLGFDVLRKRS